MMFGPLSGKQQREWAKHFAKEQRETAKQESEESRKQELHEIKLQEAAAKANQGIAHKEDVHGAKMKELGAPLGSKQKLNREKLGLPSLNPLADTGVFGRGHHTLPGLTREEGYAKGTNNVPAPSDTVPAMLTPGEAVIPRAAAQDPKNKAVIKRMVNEGRQANRGYADGTTKVRSPINPNLVLPPLPNLNRKGFADGTENVDPLKYSPYGGNQIEDYQNLDYTPTVDQLALQAQATQPKVIETPVPRVPVTNVGTQEPRYQSMGMATGVYDNSAAKESQPVPTRTVSTAIPAAPFDPLNNPNLTDDQRKELQLARDQRDISQTVNKVTGTGKEVAASMGTGLVALPYNTFVAKPTEALMNSRLGNLIKGNTTPTTVPELPDWSAKAVQQTDVNARKAQDKYLNRAIEITGQGTHPDDYFRMTARAEASDDPNAGSKVSSARGLTGTTKGTYELLQKKYPELRNVEFGSDKYKEINFQRKLSDIHYNEESAQLRNAGLPVTYENLRAAHFGPNGVKAMAADSNTPIDKIFSPEEVKANPYFGKTAGDFKTFVANNTAKNLGIKPNEVPKPNTGEVPVNNGPTTYTPESDLSVPKTSYELADSTNRTVADITKNSMPQLAAAEQKAKQEGKDKDKGFWQGVFEDLYGKDGLIDRKELVRFAALAAASKAMGYNTLQSVRYAGRSALQAGDQRQARNEAHKERMEVQAHADAKAAELAAHTDRRTMGGKLIDQRYDYNGVMHYVNTGDTSKLGEPRASYEYKDNMRAITVDNGPLSGQSFQTREAKEVTGKHKGTVTTQVKYNGQWVPYERFADAAGATGGTVVDYSESVHGPQAKAKAYSEMLPAWEKLAEDKFKRDFGTSDIKGKPNTARANLPTGGTISRRAESLYASMGYNPNDLNQRREMGLILDNALEDLARDHKADPKSVKNIDQYITRNMMVAKTGLDSSLFNLPDNKPMPANRISELHQQAQTSVYQAHKDDKSFVSNPAKMNDAVNNKFESLYKRWSDKTEGPKLRKKYSGSETQSAFFMFAKDNL